MAARTFVSKWLLNTRTGQLEQEVDEIRSQYPPTVVSGYASFGTTSVNNLLAVPSGCRFHLQFIWLDNEAAGNAVFFYDGPGTSVPVGGVVASASTTKFITVGPGVVFQSAVYASAAALATALHVRVGGILRESGPE